MGQVCCYINYTTYKHNINQLAQFNTSWNVSVNIINCKLFVIWNPVTQVCLYDTYMYSFHHVKSALPVDNGTLKHHKELIKVLCLDMISCNTGWVSRLRWWDNANLSPAANRIWHLISYNDRVRLAITAVLCKLISNWRLNILHLSSNF